jgi:hypothetical protein
MPLFAVAHPLAGSRLLARFAGGVLEWTELRDETSWHADKKNARAAFRKAWMQAAAERRERLDGFRREERAARELAQEELAHASEERREAVEKAFFGQLESFERRREEAEKRADDAWLDCGSEAVLFEKPDRLLRTPGFELFGFALDDERWACVAADGSVHFSDAGERIALFRGRAAAAEWAKKNLKDHPQAALVSLRSEIADLSLALEPDASERPQWMQDALAALEGQIEEPAQPRASSAPKATAQPKGAKAKKAAKDQAIGRFSPPAQPAKKAQRPRSDPSVQ